MPYFIGQFIELVVSMKRIQDFMVCDTLNTSIIRQLDVGNHLLIIFSLRRAMIMQLSSRMEIFIGGFLKKLPKTTPKRKKKLKLLKKKI